MCSGEEPGWETVSTTVPRERDHWGRSLNLTLMPATACASYYRKQEIEERKASIMAQRKHSILHSHWVSAQKCFTESSHVHSLCPACPQLPAQPPPLHGGCALTPRPEHSASSPTTPLERLSSVAPSGGKVSESKSLSASVHTVPWRHNKCSLNVWEKIAYYTRETVVFWCSQL